MKSRPTAHASQLLFLLSQVGAHSAARFAQVIGPLGLTPPHSGVLRLLAETPGLSQQQLSTQLRVHPSRLVALVDDLEARGFAERRQSPDDRRTHAVQLTDKGRRVIAEIGQVASTLQQELGGALDADERKTLTELLKRIADQQGLTPGVHPGFSKLSKKAE
ncbi:MAG TPA: MarR family transcriptional regulator [Polyangiales bacterium]|nr:MarR family transcriptional regulator [Polyangiales bacterium]